MWIAADDEMRTVSTVVEYLPFASLQVWIKRNEISSNMMTFVQNLFVATATVARRNLSSMSLKTIVSTAQAPKPVAPYK